MRNTLYKDNNILYKSLEQVFHKFGFKPTEREMTNWKRKDYRSILKPFIWEHIFQNPYCRHDLGIYKDIEDVFESTLMENYFVEKNVKYIDQNLPFFCKNLQSQNIKICTNTDLSINIQSKLVHYLHLHEFIDDWISSENVKKGKPYPYMIHSMLEKHNIQSVKNVIKIGDSILDMKEGKNAGCGLVVGVLSGEFNEKELIDNGADVVYKSIIDFKL